MKRIYFLSFAIVLLFLRCSTQKNESYSKQNNDDLRPIESEEFHGFISNQDIIEAIDLDLKSLMVSDEIVGADLGNFRYISFAKYYNAGYSIKEIEEMIFSFSLIINSVNFDSKFISPPDFLYHFFGSPLREMDSFVSHIAEQQGKSYILSRTIVRIDTSLYGHRNIFGLNFDKYSENFQLIFNRRILQSSTYRFIVHSLTGLNSNNVVPIIDGGSFSDAISRGDKLYHEFANLPENEKQLLEKFGDPNFEAEFNFILETKIANPNLFRFGMFESDKSSERLNRIMERLNLGNNKYYWRSYDFFSQNLDAEVAYLRPLGPKSAIRPENRNLSDFAFQHDGSTVVIGLENGLQGYAIIDGEGTLITEAPTDLLVDSRTQTVTSGVITNGYGFMITHDLGMRAIPDGAFNNDFTNLFGQIGNIPAEKAAFALYFERSEVEAVLAKDRRRFQEAVVRAVPEPSTLGIEVFGDIYDQNIGSTYHVKAVQIFGKSLDTKMIAAEFGMDVENFILRLSTMDLGGLEKQLIDGTAKVDRIDFESKIKAAIIDQLF